MEKAVGYIRVSTDEQARGGLSLDAQKAKIAEYAQLKDLRLAEIIEDRGISAKNLKRPGLQKVLRMAESGKVKAVIVCKLDRMFRSTVDTLETTKKFDKWDIAFHSIQETLDTDSAIGRFFLTIIAAIAEMERSIIGERTKAVLQHKKANGEKTGGDVPYGYNADETGHLVKNKKEQRIIRKVHQFRSKDWSLSRIARELNSKGYKTKKGKQWYPQTIKRVLSVG